jgi:hypothetical protein
MIEQSRMGCRRLVAAALGVVLLGGLSAGAQTLSTPTLTNNSDPNDLFLGTSSVPSRERETGGTVLSSSPAGSFLTRFTALVTSDGDGGPGGAGGLFLSADYDLGFTATAPGAYRLTVATVLRGDLNLVNDSASGASADVGPVLGLLTGGTLESGGLDLPDPGGVSGSGGATLGIDENNSATIFGVSNGAPVAHTLRFQWTNFATTSATPGDEAAVRLGGTSDVPTETAGNYPGSPSRTQADDGHFVTVTIESLCGNGTIDNGPAYVEDCDEGPANGTASSCCSNSCTFKADGSSCSDGDTCTLGDACTAGVCQPTTAQTCGLCETCSPMGGCQIGPRTACKLGTLPKKSSLLFNDKTPDTSDQVTFKWVKGQETQTPDFGSPLTSDGYALCVFDAANNLVFKSTAPAGGVCGTKPCWKALGVKGFGYKDSARTPDGADKITLKAGLAGKAKAQFKGKGPDLPSFGLPLPLPATVQLQSGNGQCWAASFSAAGVSTNTATQFKGKAD